MSATTAELRAMRWWHLPEVSALEQDIFGATAWSSEQFLAELAAADRWLRVLCDQGHVIGYVDVAVQGRDADLMTIAVASGARGRGLGALMLDEAMRWAATCGVHHMFLEVADDNPAAGQLYAGRGFVAIDRRPSYYGDGTDAVIMRAALHRGFAEPQDEPEEVR